MSVARCSQVEKDSSKTVAAHSLNVRRNLTDAYIQLREPVAIGHYSLERIGVTTLKYNEDTSQLKFLYLPTEKSFSFDLCDGYSNSFACEHSSEGLTNLFKWVLNNRDKFSIPHQKDSRNSLNTDFICFRGLLSNIMNTPYERKCDWCIHAVKFKNTVYMLEKLTARRLREEENKSEYANKASFGGYRFEEFICSEKEDTVPLSHLINGLNRNEFNVVYRSRLNSHSLVYGAEVDCRKPNGDPNKFEFVEIKTTKEFNSKRDYDIFCRYKAMKWWSQSYLAGIKTVVCGYRDDNFTVRKIDTYSVNSLPRLGAEFWCSNVSLNFLDTFLKFVKKCVIEENQNITYEFFWSPDANDVVCKKLDLKDEILPEWYRESFV